MNRSLFQDLAYDEVPLLSESRLKFFNDFNSAIEDKIHEEATAPRRHLPRLEFVPREADEFIENVRVIEDNFRTILNRLRQGRLTKNKFISVYPKWKKIRSDGIQQLQEIADAINLDRYNCNVSKLVGYSTSIIGGILTVGSAVLTVATLGAATPLLIAGGSLTAAGASTALGTSVTEYVLLKKKVEKAQEVIEEDRKCFQEMGEWLEHARELQDAIEAVMSIDVVGGLAKHVEKFVNDALNIANEYRRYNFIRERVEMLFDLIPQIIRDSVPLTFVAGLIAIILAFCLLLQNSQNRLVFDGAAVTVRGILGIFSLVDDGLDVLRLSSLFRGSTGAATAVTRGAIAVVGIGLDIAGIALTSIDVHRGSISPEAVKIAEGCKEMEKEAKVLERIFNDLESTTDI